MTTEIPPPETKAVTIRALDVRKSYEQGAIAVLKGVDLEVRRGEVVALCGPSGCGKSTLLHLAGGLDEPDSGTIEVNGRTLDTRRSMVNFLRHEVGFVFQLHNLIPDLTMEENCLLPAVAAGSSRLEANERLLTLATRIGLEHRLRQRIHKLSGGERQRAAICRALMNRPSILLADEPTGALDERSSAAVFELLLELVRQEGATLLMATHDLTLASTCDRVVQMHDGKIHED
jgi:ABC-type lipoprotein export system ATPase subunit